MSTVWVVSIVLQWLVLGFLCAVVVSLLRQVGALSLRLAPPAAPAVPGTEVEAHELPLVGGGTFTFGGVRGQPTLTVFLAPGCAACEGAVAHLRRIADAHTSEELALLVVLDADAPDSRGYIAEKGLEGLAVCLLRVFPRRYAPTRGTPFAISLSPAGTVAMRGRAGTLEELEELVLVARHASPAGNGQLAATGAHELSIEEVVR